MAKPKMRVIPLKAANGEVPAYRDMLKGMFERAKKPQAPTSVKEIREVAPILDAIDEAKDGDKLYLTESQYADCKERMNSNPWASNMRGLLPFFDDIENAKEEEMSPK